MNTLIFLSEAIVELNEAVDYYESKKFGLGVRFREEINRLCEQVAIRPSHWHERKSGYRRANCSGFPYYIGFYFRQSIVYIAAISHESRQPDYWIDRLP